MDAKIALVDLLEKVEELESAGTLQVDTGALTKLLKDWNKQIAASTEVSDIQRQHQLELWKVQSTTDTAHSVEMFKAVLESGQTALKSATIINGGAAAALLALLAEALKGGPSSATAGFLSTLGLGWFSFMLGLGSAGLATASRYVSQALYSESLRRRETTPDSQFRRYGGIGRNAAIFFGVASFATFFIGSALVFGVMVSGHKNTM